MLQSCSVVLEPDESTVYHTDFSALCARVWEYGHTLELCAHHRLMSLTNFYANYYSCSLNRLLFASFNKHSAWKYKLHCFVSKIMVILFSMVLIYFQSCSIFIWQTLERITAVVVCIAVCTI